MARARDSKLGMVQHSTRELALVFFPTLSNQRESPWILLLHLIHFLRLLFPSPSLESTACYALSELHFSPSLNHSTSTRTIPHPYPLLKSIHSINRLDLHSILWEIKSGQQIHHQTREGSYLDRVTSHFELKIVVVHSNRYQGDQERTSNLRKLTDQNEPFLLSLLLPLLPLPIPLLNPPLIQLGHLPSKYTKEESRNQN